MILNEEKLNDFLIVIHEIVTGLLINNWTYRTLLIMDGK